jgi:hypothetical protein
VQHWLEPLIPDIKRVVQRVIPLPVPLHPPQPRLAVAAESKGNETCGAPLCVCCRVIVLSPFSSQASRGNLRQDEQDTVQPDAPPDSQSLIYILTFIMGIGVLLPWNAFITASDYFGRVFSTITT